MNVLPEERLDERGAPGERVTIREVAREAGVSITTVSRYINGSGQVSQDAARKVRGAIERLNYVPSISAQSLRSGASRVVLLVVPDICNPFYSQMAKTVQNLLRGSGYVMALYDSSNSSQEIEAIKIAQQMYVRGILLASIEICDAVVARMLSLNLPVVVLNAYRQLPFDSVHVHGSEGTYLATRHLIALGHKRIGFAGAVLTSMIAQSRKSGYERAMREAGLAIRADDVVEMGFSHTDGYECGRYFARRLGEVTAVCCANDEIALGLLAALHERGVRVPEQISVTGMDNIPYAKISNPSLTSVTNDSERFAREGVKMLLERIDGTVTGKPRDVIVRHELIVRSSVSTPARRAGAAEK